MVSALYPKSNPPRRNSLRAYRLTAVQRVDKYYLVVTNCLIYAPRPPSLQNGILWSWTAMGTLINAGQHGAKRLIVIHGTARGLNMNIILAAVLTVSVLNALPLTPAQRFERAVNAYLMKFPESERLDRAIELFRPVTTKRRDIPPEDLILMELQRIESELSHLKRNHPYDD